jgi:hypothetical protein
MMGDTTKEDSIFVKLLQHTGKQINRYKKENKGRPTDAQDWHAF